MAIDLTAANPDLAGIDVEALTGIGAHLDGSGGGLYQFAWELCQLREEEARIGVLRAFIYKHQQTLARLSWDADSGRYFKVKDSDTKELFPEIEIYSRVCNRRSSNAKEIAALWPDAEWVRAKPSYDEDTVRDYLAKVDGVMLRIRKAEVVEPVKQTSRFGPCGPVRIK